MIKSKFLGQSLSLIYVIFFIAGCSSVASHMVAPDYAKKAIRLIALMPMENKTSDQMAAKMLRSKMLDELYFKGYPKIPLEFIDLKLQTILKEDAGKKSGLIPPKTVGEALGVDALLYCTLSESETSITLFYAPTSLSVACELKSAKTEETLWQAQYSTVERNFGYSRYDLEMKVSQIYEAAIKEVVDKVMATLPDGPDLTG